MKKQHWPPVNQHIIYKLLLLTYNTLQVMHQHQATLEKSCVHHLQEDYLEYPRLTLEGYGFDQQG